MHDNVDHLYGRLIALEDRIRRHVNAPTFPIYDPSNPPSDPIECQVFIGTDGSLNWYSSGSWHTQPGTPSIVGSAPVGVEGQVAVGSEGSFHWFVNGSWHSASFINSIVGSVPEANIGQIAIGTNDTFHWFA